MIALSALALSLLLMLKVFSLQRQLNKLKSDLQGPSIGQKVYGSSKPNINAPSSSNLDERLRLLVASGKRIQAIKEYKKASGLGLKEAKEYVDYLDQGQH